MAGRKPVEGLAGLEPRCRHVAELHVPDLTRAEGRDVGRRAAAAREVIGVDQQATLRMGRLGQHLTQSIETVELARLRVELDGEPHAVAGRDVADLLDAARGGLDVARAHVDGTHHRGAAQTGRPFALLGEDAEQAAPHVAIRPHPSVLDADTRHRQAAFLHDVDDGVGVHALLGRAHEIDAAQLDGVPARLAGRAQRLGQRGRVQRPRVKGQSEAHGRYCTWLLSRPMEPCLHPRGSRPPRHRRRALPTAPGTSGITGSCTELIRNDR